MAERSEQHSAWTGPRLLLGTQSVREALRVHGARVTRVLFQSPGTPAVRGLARLAEASGVGDVRWVPKAELDALARGSLHQGAAAWAPPLLKTELASLLLEPQLLALGLDGIQDPQNFGAVVRSAVALAAAPLIWPLNSSAPLTPTTFRASAGAIEHAKLCQVNSLRAALQDAAAADVQVIGLAADAERDLRDIDLTRPSVIVVGSEGEGLSRGVRQNCTVLGRLGKLAHVDSLNASVAAALALYEAIGQRARNAT